MYHIFPEYINPEFLHDNPFDFNCRFCNSPLVSSVIDDLWEISEPTILQIHTNTMKEYKEIHDLEDCYLNLRMDSSSIEGPFRDICPVCGWWRIRKSIWICAEEWQIWEVHFGIVGTIKNLDLQDINIPLNEIRAYLTAKYGERYNVNPLIFEKVVSSVFKSLGYAAFATGYSNDGGIDVVLENTDKNQLGVQVKRYKNKIKVEQIRSFIGAMVLGGYTKGFFVTTSYFQPGAISAASKASLIINPIELIDADKFYAQLKDAQLKDGAHKELPFEINTKTLPNLYYYGYETPCNSL